MSPESNPDQWVDKLYRDLTDAVERQPAWRRRARTGFYDQDIPLRSNWKKSLSRALSAAEVFVPLYSPGYIARSWPGKEWACFRRRLELAGLENPERRFVPVLWTPLPDAAEPPGYGDALAVGAGEPDYAENGLQALLRIEQYHDSYRSVVGQLAERIVAIAGEFPLPPSDTQDIDDMESAFLPGARLATFAVEVAAPTDGSGVTGHHPGEYGATSAQWRPFQEQILPLADYARQVAERLDFDVEVSGLAAASAGETRGPGIIVIDPWFVADESARRLLESELRRLPQWTLPLLVVNSPGDARDKKLVRQVRKMLGAAFAVEPGRRARKDINSLKEFISTMPAIVAEAERRYLRHGGAPLPHGERGTRPRLGGRRSNSSAAEAESSKEAPDA